MTSNAHLTSNEPATFKEFMFAIFNSRYHGQINAFLGEIEASDLTVASADTTGAMSPRFPGSGNTPHGGQGGSFSARYSAFSPRGGAGAGTGAGTGNAAAAASAAATAAASMYSELEANQEQDEQQLRLSLHLAPAHTLLTSRPSAMVGGAIVDKTNAAHNRGINVASNASSKRGGGFSGLPTSAFASNNKGRVVSGLARSHGPGTIAGHDEVMFLRENPDAGPRAASPDALAAKWDERRRKGRLGRRGSMDDIDEY